MLKAGLIGAICGVFLAIVFILGEIRGMNQREDQIMEIQSIYIEQLEQNILLDARINELFNEYNLRKEIENQHIVCVDVVMAQAKLETGYFTSKVFIFKNNLFGFTNQEIMYFDNWINCVKFYKQWQVRYYQPRDSTNTEYLNFLKQYKYASDTNYIRELKRML